MSNDEQYVLMGKLEQLQDRLYKCYATPNTRRFVPVIQAEIENIKAKLDDTKIPTNDNPVLIDTSK